MKLVIAEKPSMARDIAAVLGANQRKQGYLEGNNYIVTWCIGHLIELSEPDDYDSSLKQWSLSTLPFIPETFKYKVNPQTSDQFKVIKSLINQNSVNTVVNSCDSGREGELIFSLVYQMSGCKKPVERLWISSLTKDEIQKGFRNLKPGNNYSGLRDSAHGRQRADYLFGLNLTRAFTIKARNGNGKSELYSVGRVQTPVLAMIVNREQEIADFVPEKFYQVSASFYSQVGSYQGLWVGQDGFRIAEEQDAQAIVDKVANQDGFVEKVDKKLVKEKPPLLHDLTSLQRVANTKYGLTADQTLKIAQSLYEAKLITYPRTSSQYLSESLAYEITDHLFACNVGVYQQFVSQIQSLPSGIRLTSRHVSNDKITDHHAIIVTKNKADLNTLDEDQKKVYDLIVRRFLAAFYPDTESEQTTVFTNVLGEKFVSKGKVILIPGWRVVEAPEAQGNNTSFNKPKGKFSSSTPDQIEDEDKLLPPLTNQQPVEVTQAQVLQKWTKPPARFTEGSLLLSMETAGKEILDDVLRQTLKDQGLGTPATRASIIETLISREYIVRDKKVLLPTQKGKLLIELLPSPLLKSPKLTAEWEFKLAQIEKGQYSLKAFMDEIKQKTVELVKEVAQANISGATEQVAREKAENELSCPKCLIENREGYLVERSGQYGKFLCCMLGKEACGYFSNVPKNAKQRKALIEGRCPNCDGAIKLHIPKEKDKSPVLLCLNYNQCKGVVRLDELNNNGTSASDKSTNKQVNVGSKQAIQTNVGGAKEPIVKDSKAQKGLSCPKCVIEGREGRLIERPGQYGNFLCCALGKEACGYLSTVPKDQRQCKALVESRCPNCKGATKLNFPTGKDKSPVLLCLNYNQCKGIIRLNDFSTINPSNKNTDNSINSSFVEPTNFTKPNSSNSLDNSNGSKSSSSSNNSNSSNNYNSSNSSNSSNNNRQNKTSQQQQNKETTPACKVCGKPTVKRSFKDKQGKEKHFWGCSAWAPNNQGCNAQPVWIN